ncbi:MAG: flippase-like domain-containing protein [Bacteroidaceae bacterium]|nr:flippase-like domain-containing protein [Bacteroidaceae bacterium]
MKPLYRNIFFLLGAVAVVIMLLTFDMDYKELWSHIRRAGWWFGAVVGVWVVIYFFNAVSWYFIIRNGESPSPVSLGKVYKLTISGFALNYATPCGLMGGEPYRIMELTPIIGSSRATSSVILYVMMHIFSHICFWLASVVLYIIMYTPDFMMWLLLAAVTVFCLLAIYFFIKGYKHGMIIKTLRVLSRIPWVGKYAMRFSESKHEKLLQIDSQIAELHSKHSTTFYASFLFEFCARVLTALEIFFILCILTSEVNFFNCVLIMAFTSLFGNIFFFSPMQLGAREGGFALSVSALSISGAFGVYTGLITRVREVIWIIIGLVLMRFGNSPSQDVQKPEEPSAQTS